MQYAKALVLAACIARVASDTQEVARVNAPKLTWAMQGCSQGFDSYEATALVGSFVVAGGYTKGSCDEYCSCEIRADGALQCRNSEHDETRQCLPSGKTILAAGTPRALDDELQQPLLYKAPLSPSTGQPDVSQATMLQRKSTGGAAIASITALGSAGDFVVCGYVNGVFTDTVSTGLKAGGEKDIFVSRYNASMQEVWTVQPHYCSARAPCMGLVLCKECTKCSAQRNNLS
eukprot:20378-Heterococcus_DN1.PRE.1